MSKSSKDQIEQDEKKILFELVKNSNENIDTIAKHCGFSRQKAWRMTKQLEANKLIWGYTAVIDVEKIGLKHFIFMLKRTTRPVEKNQVNRIIDREIEDIAKDYGIMIESSAFIHGEYDWMVTFAASGIKEAKKFADKMIEKYPNFAEKISLSQTLLFIKKHNILNPDRKNLKDFL